MPVEMVNWIEIPVRDMPRAKAFYEQVLELEMVDLKVENETYTCFPNKSGEGFSGALVQYDFILPGKDGPIIYLNARADMNGLIERIKDAGGTIVQGKNEIAPGMGVFAFFEDTEGNFLGLQGDR